MSARTVGARIAEDLRGAAGVLNASGWSQNVGLHDAETGAHDLTGSIYVATGYHQKDKGGAWRAHALKNSAGRRASDCIRWVVQSLPTNTLADYNDRVCRSQADAVDLLLRCAEDAERLLCNAREAERRLG